MLNKYKKGFSFIELIIVIIIISVLAAMSGPTCTVGKSSAKRRKIRSECFSNQRVLEGAIEMYNMDNPEKITIALPGADYENIEAILIREKYLYDPLIPPCNVCSYGYIEDEKGAAGVFCKNHGKPTIYSSSYNENPKLPEYDKSKEKPLSQDYYQVRNTVKTSKTIKEIREKIIEIIISKPFLIFIGITIFILAVLPYKKKNKSNIKINR